jgi:competence protein ComEA
MLKKWLATLVILMMFFGSVFAAVEVNTATQAELETIKGIGPAKSAKIIEERKKGPFKDEQDLIKRVSGIGQKSLDKLMKQGLTVNGKGSVASTSSTGADTKVEEQGDKKNKKDKQNKDVSKP